jgi:hypothetical protein
MSCSREATHEALASLPELLSTGTPGVYIDTSRSDKKYCTYLGAEGKRREYFDTLEKAIVARETWEAAVGI